MQSKCYFPSGQIKLQFKIKNRFYHRLDSAYPATVLQNVHSNIVRKPRCINWTWTYITASLFFDLTSARVVKRGSTTASKIIDRLTLIQHSQTLVPQQRKTRHCPRVDTQYTDLFFAIDVCTATRLLIFNTISISVYPRCFDGQCKHNSCWRTRTESSLFPIFEHLV